VTLLTTTRDGNDYYIPADYVSFVNKAESMGCSLHLDVYMTSNVTALLSSHDYRAAAVSEIVNELTVSYNKLGRNPYSGVTIDFEGLKGKETADHFTAFLTELDAALAPLNKALFVAVQPVLTTGAYFDGYDYRAIGEVADKVILMAYDYHASSIPAHLVGSTYHQNAALTPFSQVYDSLKAITDAETGVQDKSKIVLGLLYDKKGVSFATVFVMGACAVSMVLLLLLGGSSWVAWVMAVFFAIGNCCGTVSPPVTTSAVFGTRYYGRLFGIVNLFLLVGNMVGPPLAAGLYDRFGSYRPAWIVCIACSLLSIVCVLYARRRCQKDAVWQQLEAQPQ